MHLICTVTALTTVACELLIVKTTSYVYTLLVGKGRRECYCTLMALVYTAIIVHKLTAPIAS
jgi:hypothetical protein